MKRIDSNEYKEIILGCLKELHRVCSENNLRYTIAFGTLLGAVRHRGFIPWDDDIDVVMPRLDYERLVSIADSTFGEYYSLISIETNRNFTAPLAKLIDNRTLLIQKKARDKVDLGAYVDVFVCDNISDDINIRNRQFKNATFFQRCWGYCYYRKNGNIRSIKEFFKRILFFSDGRGWAERMNKYAKSQSSKDTTMIGNLMYSTNRSLEIMPMQDFDNLIEIYFEDAKVLTIPSYDEFLTRRYGDYMQLPPLEQQITHHNFDVYWKNS